MAIIFSIAAGGFNRMNSNSNLSAVAQNMASDITTVALSALHSDTFQLQTPYGWGVYFDVGNNSYTIFADLDNDKTYDLNEKFKEVRLTRNISISSVCFTVCATVNGSLDFTVLATLAYYDNTQITTITDDLTIDVTDAVSGVTKVISVNSFGAVSLQ